ncbi:MAG TPA: cupin domain-containing protein [Acidimicrobiia bacterium]|nr:cupin domain-containing protein [Acidimicrobiia bacterium]
MDPIKVVRAEERVVSEADATSGMVREEAFSAEGVWAGLVRTAPLRPSGWHHHGDYDTYVYVTSGKLLFEFGADGADVVEAGPGDFVHVPKHVVHRESNPSSEPGIVSLVRTGSGPPVINVDGPR